MTDKPGAPKVFDIARPGKSAPSASGRPIIVTNRPILKDPMMAESEAAPAEAEKTETPTKPTLPAGKVKVAPLHEHVEPETAPEPAVAKDVQDATPQNQADTTVEPADDTAAAEVPASPGPASETDATSNEAPDETAKKPDTKADEAAARQQAERAAELEKLAESRKYYLPINQVEKRRNKRSALLGLVLIVVLGFAWADIALDAGLVKISGVKPITHFFHK